MAEDLADSVRGVEGDETEGGEFQDAGDAGADAGGPDAGTGAEGGAGDVFEGLSLDESFINAAAIHEGSADERVERLRRIDAAHRELARQRETDRHAAQRADRKASRRGRGVRSNLGSGPTPWLGIAFVVVLAVGLGWYALGQEGGGGSGATGQPRHGDAFTYDGVVTDFPSPASDRQSSPLGTPPPPPAESGPFRFLATQAGTGQPVAYDPCRPIHVVVNGRTAPSNGAALVRDALASVSTATGLVFVLEGETTEIPMDQRAPVQADRYGDRWAPVLIAWSDPVETPGLANDVAGQAGSQRMSKDSSEEVYVTGLVTLDGPAMVEMIGRPDGHDQARAVIEHELGHIVGLDHVEDRGELMNPEGVEGIVSFGPGDRAGLSQLGRGGCHPDI